VEVTKALETLVEKLNLSSTNTSVLGEVLERFGVIVERIDVADILIDGVEGLTLGSRGEEHGGISALDGVLLTRRLVAWGALNLLNVTNRPRAVEVLRNLFGRLGLSSS